MTSEGDDKQALDPASLASLLSAAGTSSDGNLEESLNTLAYLVMLTGTYQNGKSGTGGIDASGPEEAKPEDEPGDEKQITELHSADMKSSDGADTAPYSELAKSVPEQTAGTGSFPADMDIHTQTKQSKDSNSQHSSKREIEWQKAKDPDERRRLKRMAKNRATAAASRERKKQLLTELSTRVQQLQDENDRLRSELQKKNLETYIFRELFNNFTFSRKQKD